MINDIENSYIYDTVLKASANILNQLIITNCNMEYYYLLYSKIQQYFNLILTKLQNHISNITEFRRLTYQVMLIQNPVPRLYMLIIIAQLDQYKYIINLHNIYLQLKSVFDPVQQFFLMYTMIKLFKHDTQFQINNYLILKDAILIYDKINDGSMFVFLLNDFFNRNNDEQQIQQILDLLKLITKDHVRMYLLDKISQYSATAIVKYLKPIIQECTVALQNQQLQYLIQEYIVFITMKLFLLNTQKEIIVEVITIVHDHIPFDLLLQILLKFTDIQNKQLYEGIFCSFDIIFGHKANFESRYYYKMIQLLSKVLPRITDLIKGINLLILPYNFIKNFTKENSVHVLKVIIEILYYNNIDLSLQDVQQLQLIAQDITDNIEAKDCIMAQLAQIAERIENMSSQHGQKQVCDIINIPQASLLSSVEE